jgi:hypothetical protein
MRYALLIYGNESEIPDEITPEIQAPWRALNAEMDAAGVTLLKNGAQLEQTPTAESIRVRDGEVLRIDGPFAETSEQLGGFYLLECESMEEAVAWAAKIPAAKGGTIEVRPVVPPWDPE